MSDDTGRPRRVTCHHCRDVIGVYEVAVLETGSGPVETSLMTDPCLADSGDPCYHRACYQADHGESG
jgi:hypothetical protein